MKRYAEHSPLVLPWAVAIYSQFLVSESDSEWGIRQDLVSVGFL